ncbi:hypothetical protein FACS1894156_2400 [Bacteroidia bacterium]|nr:hypothetical protein FACS1894156_2400 [Bacteroidia bacterium]
MEEQVDKVYEQFDAERKKNEALLADEQDLRELEEKINNDTTYHFFIAPQTDK